MDLEAARFRIMAIEDGAIRAQALAFCLKTGLFDSLDRGPLTFEEISREASLAPRVLPTLLGFLCSEGLLARDAEGRFGNTEAAAAFLVRSSPSYVGGRGLLFAGFFDAIAHLPESLASGQPWTARGQHDMFEGFGEEEQRWFAEGMYSSAVHGARALMGVVDFSRTRRLLDVGGNAGGYALTIAAAHPGLQATICDLDALRSLAEERIAAADLGARVRFVAGSFFADALPRGHDMLLLSSILHDWPAAECAIILRQCWGALDAGGRVIVTEPMLREDHTGPDHPAASGLTMALLGGENRTPSAIASMLRAAGFDDTWESPVGPQNSVVSGRKL